MDNPVYFYPFARMSSSLTSPKPRRNQEYTQEDILTTLEVNDAKAKEEFDSQLSLLTSKVFKTPSTGQDQVLSPSVKLRKKCSIKRFLSGGGKPKDKFEVKRSQSLTQDLSPQKNLREIEDEEAFVPMIERSKSFSLPWTNSNSSSNNISVQMSHDECDSSFRKRNSSGPVCVQRQPSILHQHGNLI